mgnify:CR=1 FL=1
MNRPRTATKRRFQRRARALAALDLVVASAPVFAVAVRADTAAGARKAKQERFPYVATIAKSATGPDVVAVIGADPRRSDVGRIVDRVDMPNIGDELHRFGDSADQKRLVAAGPVLEPEHELRHLALRHRPRDRQAGLADARRELVGELRERGEEDDRAGRPAHDAARPERPAGTGRALR